MVLEQWHLVRVIILLFYTKKLGFKRYFNNTIMKFDV